MDKWLTPVVVAINGAALLAIFVLVIISDEGRHDDACKTAGGTLVRSSSDGWVCVKTIEVKS